MPGGGIAPDGSGSRSDSNSVGAREWVTVELEAGGEMHLLSRD